MELKRLRGWIDHELAVHGSEAKRGEVARYFGVAHYAEPVFDVCDNVACAGGVIDCVDARHPEQRPHAAQPIGQLAEPAMNILADEVAQPVRVDAWVVLCVDVNLHVTAVRLQPCRPPSDEVPVWHEGVGLFFVARGSVFADLGKPVREGRCGDVGVERTVAP